MEEIFKKYPTLERVWDNNKNIEDPYILQKLTQKYWWKCTKENHSYYNYPRRALRNECGVCKGTQVIKGVNDLSTLYPHIALLFSPKSPIKPDQISPMSNKKALFLCSQQHERLARISTVTLGGGCVYCANLKVLEGYNDLYTHYPHLAQELSPKYHKKSTEILCAGSEKVLWFCSTCKGEWKAEVKQRVSGTQCPYCNHTLILKGYNDFMTLFPKEAILWSPKNKKEPNEVFPYSNHLYLWECSKKHEWKTSVNKISSGTHCPECSRHNYSSRGEKELKDLISLITQKEIKDNERNILNGFEIDIYIPELKVGIEYNGTYWHSDKIIKYQHSLSSKEYHQNKFNKAAEKGVTLLFVWEDDWNEKNELVQSAIERVLRDKSDIDPILTILSKG